MKLQNRVLLIGLGVAALITLVIAFATDSWPGNGFCLMAGLTGMFGAAGYTGLSIILLLLKDKSYSKGLFTCAIMIGALGFVLFKFFPQY